VFFTPLAETHSPSKLKNAKHAKHGMSAKHAGGGHGIAAKHFLCAFELPSPRNAQRRTEKIKVVFVLVAWYPVWLLYL
jgi:hypothetical protein